MNFFSIDIETTELDERKGLILSLAIVADGHSFTHLPVAELPYLHVGVKYESLYGAPKAIVMNAQLLKDIDTGAIFAGSIEDVIGLAIAFITQHGTNTSTKPGERARYTGAGKNFSSFDRRWLRHHMPELEKRFHQRALDPAMFYAHASDDVLPDTNTCLARAAVPNQTKHDALDDARNVCLLLRRAGPDSTPIYRGYAVDGDV